MSTTSIHRHNSTVAVDVANQSSAFAVRAGAWIFVAYLFFTNKFTSIATGVNQESSLSIGPEFLLKVGVTFLCGIYGLYYSPIRSNNWWKFPGLYIPAIVLWCLISAPFSLHPKFATQATLSLAMVSIFVPAVLVHVGIQRVLQLFFWTVFAFTILSTVVYLVDPTRAPPETQAEFRVAGLTHPTALARYCDFLLVIAICLKDQISKRWKWLATIVGVVLLLTRTRTAIVTAILSLGFLVFRRWSYRRRLIMSTAGLACLLFGVLLLFGLWGLTPEKTSVLLVRSDPEELHSGNGRLEIWHDAWKMFTESPLFGAGQGCQRFKFLALAGANDEYSPMHSHNQLLDTLVTLGIIGGLLHLGMCFSLGVDCFRYPVDWIDGLYLAFMIESLTETPLFSVVPGIDTMLWLVVIYARQFGAVEESSGIRGAK